MAENESLDIGISRRWAHFVQALRRGEAIEIVSERFLTTLIGGWRKTQKQLLKYGTSLDEVRQRSIDLDTLEPLFRMTQRHDYVKLFEIEQRPFDSAEAMMERVVSASAERVLDQVRHVVFGTDLCPNAGAWNVLKQQLMRPIAGRVAQFAERLVARPGAPIRMPSLSAAGHVGPPRGSFVHVSLLNQSPQVSNGARL